MSSATLAPGDSKVQPSSAALSRTSIIATAAPCDLCKHRLAFESPLPGMNREAGTFPLIRTCRFCGIVSSCPIWAHRSWQKGATSKVASRYRGANRRPSRPASAARRRRPCPCGPCRADAGRGRDARRGACRSACAAPSSPPCAPSPRGRACGRASRSAAASWSTSWSSSARSRSARPLSANCSASSSSARRSSSRARYSRRARVVRGVVERRRPEADRESLGRRPSEAARRRAGDELQDVDLAPGRGEQRGQVARALAVLQPERRGRRSARSRRRRRSGTCWRPRRRCRRASPAGARPAP